MTILKGNNFFSFVRILLIALILIIGGIALFTNKIQIFTSDSASNVSMIGTVLEKKGLVLIKREGDSSFVSLKNNRIDIGEQTIVTGIESRAVIQFGETFEILENSSVKINGERNRALVYVNRGSVQRSNPQDNVIFFVDGKEQQGLKIESAKEHSLTGKTFEKKAGSTHIPAPEVDNDFQQILTETIKLHQRFLEKCIIKYYEKLNGQLEPGTLVSQFTINKKGRVEKVSVTESPYDDKKFIACIEEVISRIQFKGYKGEAKTVNFPIAIQIPN